MERSRAAVLAAMLLALGAVSPSPSGCGWLGLAVGPAGAGPAAAGALNGTAGVPLPLIWAVLPDAYNSSETIVVRNCGDADADLAGWSLTDLEGSLVFGGRALAPGEEIVVCQSARDYADLAGGAPDMTYKEGWAETEGTFRLANDADEVLLLDPDGGVADAFVYGRSAYDGEGWAGSPVPKRSKGELHCRGLPAVPRSDAGDEPPGAAAAGWTDADAASDWSSPIRMTLGASAYAAREFRADSATLFLSPDCSLEVMVAALRSAESAIRMHVYELASAVVVRELANASARGVEVRAIVEGEPVGGMSAACGAAAWELGRAGVEVRRATSENDVWGHRRHEFVHCKYAVIDEASFVMMSENAKQSGLPLEGQTANRGWGAWVRSPEGAAHLRGVFDSDWAAPDCVPCPGEEGPLEDEASEAWARGPRPPAEIGPFGFTLALTPDTTLRDDAILGIIASAEETLYVEQFYIYTHWGGKYDTVGSDPNPYLEAAIDAARRGVRVRFVLDSTDYNVDPLDGRDNDDTVRYVNAIARAEGLDMEARLVSPLHGFSKVHNKGVVADGEAALISSVNWNENSPCANRESALVIRSAGALYFEEAFLRDWANDLAPPVANVTCQPSAGVGEWVAFSAAMSTDDAGIANCSWCVDGDGVAEAWGTESGWAFATPGTKTVTLTVRDVGGNETSASATIAVEGEEGGVSPWWLLAGVAVIVAVGGAILLRRR